MELRETDLFRYIAATEYGPKLLELRAEATAWLEQIPTTFPHYTRHTVDHSDEVVSQASRLLFVRQEHPVVALSAAEAYIIAASAYLHDAGMVVTEGEKRRLLRSAEWNEWIAGGQPGHQRWMAVEQLRRSTLDAGSRHYLADLETRFLLAEFVRRQHHLRSGKLLQEHEPLLGRFSFGDPILLRTIADVCVGHGLSRDSLVDRDRYPDRTDVRGQTVNARFCAIMLRLGDLLDLRTDRACPLLLAQECPVPHDSLAHWTQYRRIRHRFTGHDLIEIVAECDNQDEHRLLQDWCHWLVEELDHASAVMARCARHYDWRPPRASMSGADATIRIRPATSATYRPVQWMFKLDHEIVVDRLIHDLYNYPLAFLRELLQNAFDATRVRLYADLEAAGFVLPSVPSHAPSEWRSRYPIQISIKDVSVANALSGESEWLTELVVEDVGMGMDESIVTSYLLQIGRSYYTSAPFLRTASFVPTSRFGVGFLSVFSASDHVQIETLRHGGSPSESLRLTLTGPRNYLLVDRGSRSVPGTKITLRLKARLTYESVVRAVRESCRRVEFPVEVVGQGEIVRIVSETPAQFTFTEPDYSTEGRQIELRAFDVDRPGVDGELYVVEVRSNDLSRNDADWTKSSWYRYTYPNEHPQAAARLPSPLTCFHGMVVQESMPRHAAMLARLDFRRESDRVPLGRSGLRSMSKAHEDDPVVLSRWIDVVEAHLASTVRAAGPSRWEYIQDMAREFSWLGEFWLRVPKAIRVFVNGVAEYVSAEAVQNVEKVAVYVEQYDRHRPEWARLRSTGKSFPSELGGAEPGLTIYDLLRMSKVCERAVFAGRAPAAIELVGDFLRVEWQRQQVQRSEDADDVFYFRDVGSAVGVACLLNQTLSVYKPPVLVNTSTAAGKWLSQVIGNERDAETGQAERVASRLKELVRTAAEYAFATKELGQYVDKMRMIMPAGAAPPEPFPVDPADYGILTPTRRERDASAAEMFRRLEERRRKSSPGEAPAKSPPGETF